MHAADDRAVQLRPSQAEIDHQTQWCAGGRALEPVPYGRWQHDQRSRLHPRGALLRQMLPLPMQVENDLAPPMPMEFDQGIVGQMPMQGELEDLQAGDSYIDSVNE